MHFKQKKMSLDLKRDIYNDEVYQEDMIIILLYGQKPPPHIYMKQKQTELNGEIDNLIVETSMSHCQ